MRRESAVAGPQKTTETANDLQRLTARPARLSKNPKFRTYGQNLARRRETRGRPYDRATKLERRNLLMDGSLCIVAPHWHQACSTLSDERTRNGPINAGLRCGLRPKRSDVLEGSLSDIFPVYRLDPGLGKEQERKFAMSATPNQKKARKRVDPTIEVQNCATVRGKR